MLNYQRVSFSHWLIEGSHGATNSTRLDFRVRPRNSVCGLVHGRDRCVTRAHPLFLSGSQPRKSTHFPGWTTSRWKLVSHPIFKLVHWSKSHLIFHQFCFSKPTSWTIMVRVTPCFTICLEFGPKSKSYPLFPAIFWCLNCQTTQLQPSATFQEVQALHFHDSAEDPRVVSVGTFSKLIGPGVKVGWLQADARLLKRMAAVGYVETPGIAWLKKGLEEGENMGKCWFLWETYGKIGKTDQVLSNSW